MKGPKLQVGPGSSSVFLVFCQTSRSFLFFSFSFLFWATPVGIWKGPDQGSNPSCSRRPKPQPQQLSIWALSVTHTPGHGITGSLTHWARPGIEPASSWILVGFVISELQWNSWSAFLFIESFKLLVCSDLFFHVFCCFFQVNSLAFVFKFTEPLFCLI